MVNNLVRPGCRLCYFYPQTADLEIPITNAPQPRSVTSRVFLGVTTFGALRRDLAAHYGKVCKSSAAAGIVTDPLRLVHDHQQPLDKDRLPPPGGRLGPVLVCLTPQPPPPPRVLKDSGAVTHT